MKLNLLCMSRWRLRQHGKIASPRASSPSATPSLLPHPETYSRKQESVCPVHRPRRQERACRTYICMGIQLYVQKFWQKINLYTQCITCICIIKQKIKASKKILKSQSLTLYIRVESRSKYYLFLYFYITMIVFYIRYPIVRILT